MDLKGLVINSFDNIAAGDFIQKTIEENLKETIKRSIAEIFGSWSEFSKELKDNIKNTVKVSMSDLSLPEYNKIILNIINSYVDECIQKEGLEKMKADLSEMLVGKSECALSEIVEELKSNFEDDAQEKEWDEITLIVDDKDQWFTHIYLDKEPEKSKYECSTRIMTYKGEISSVEYKDRNFDKQFFIGKLYGYEKLLFNLYASKAKLTIDKVDTYYPSPEDDY
jgi:hypothetical protein